MDEELRETLGEIKADVKEVKQVLRGKEDGIGLVGRVHDLEKTRNRWIWHIRALWTAAVGFVISYVKGKMGI